MILLQIHVTGGGLDVFEQWQGVSQQCDGRGYIYASSESQDAEAG